MNTKQLIKDFGRMLNDERLCFVGVKRAVDGVTIHRVYFADGTGKYIPLNADMHLTYDNLLACVADVLSKHPTRTTGDTLYSLRFDTRRSTDALVATTCSNYELYGERHTRMSAQLSKVLHRALNRGELNVKTTYTDRYMSNSDRSGIVQFKL